MMDPSSEPSFLDLEIRILAKHGVGQRGEGYPVEITLDGEQVSEPGMLPAEILPWIPSVDPAADGRRLFEALFSDPVLRSAWDQARGHSPRRRIRLRFDRGAAELHALPWELLRGEQGMLAAHADTPLSRYLPVNLPWGGALQERPIRVLAVISNPTDLEEQYELAPLDPALERAILKEGLGERDGGQVEIDFLEPPVTLERLEEALREGYHVLHYSGHGAYIERRGRAVLYLQADEGQTKVVADEALIGMLARQAVKPRLVTLAACQSATRSTRDAYLGLAPKLVAIGVPAVVAMQERVTVETARKLSRAFYPRLAEHGAVDRALNEARGTLLTAGRPDAAVPVLYMRLRSGQLWSEEVDARGAVLGAGPPRAFWTGLIRHIQRGRCTPIIGPRVHGRWLLRPEEVARRWASAGEYAYPFTNVDQLERVAQYLATLLGKDYPRTEFLETMTAEFYARLPGDWRPDARPDTLTDLTEAVGWSRLAADDPNEAHQVLAGLGLPLYLTTNADPFMVEALAARGKRPVRETCPWNESLDELESRFEAADAYEPTPDAPMVYHLYGSDREIDSLVLTEDDYLDFLARVSGERDRIPNVIREALSDSVLMFLGYSLYDWEFRVLMHGLVATQQRRQEFKHVTVQLELQDARQPDATAIQEFLREYFHRADINVFWGSTAQFVAELREHWEARRA